MWNIFRKKKEEVVGFQLPPIPASFREIMGTNQNHEPRSNLLTDPSSAEASAGRQGSTLEEPRSDLKEKEGVDFQEKPSPKAKSLIEILILGLAFLAPLFFLTATAPGDILSSSKQILIYGVAMAGLLVWLKIIISQGGLVLRLSGLEWGILAVIAAGLLSSIFSVNQYRSFTSSGGLLALASLGVIFFLTINFFGKKDLNKLLYAFLSGSSLAILAGTLNILGLPVFDWVSWFSYDKLIIGRAFNTAGTINGLGGLAVLVFVWSLNQYFYPVKSPTSEEERSDLEDRGSTFLQIKVLQIKVEPQYGKILLFTSLAVSGFLILFLDWWVFYAALAAGMAGIFLVPGMMKRFSGQHSKVKASRLIVPLIILVLSIVFVFTNRYFGFSVSNIFPKENMPVEVALSQRSSFNIAKETLAVNPVFGLGVESFTAAYDRFRPALINGTAFWNSRFINSNSQFFDTLTEGGFLSLATLIFLTILAFRKLKDWKLAPVFVTVLALFFLLPFSLVLMLSSLLVFAMIAVNSSGEKNTVKISMEETSLSSILSSLVFVLVVVFGLIGGYVVLQKYRGEIYLAQASRLRLDTQENLDKAISLVSKAVNANNSDDSHLNNLGNLLLRKTNFAIGDKNSKPEEISQRLENLSRSVIQIANRLTANHKNEPVNWFNAAVIYQNLIGLVGGADGAALSAYGEYVKKAKNDPKGYERIAGIHLTRADNNGAVLQNVKNKGQEIKNEAEIRASIENDYKQAEENYKKAIELKNDLSTAVYNLGTVYERNNRIKEAVKQLETVRLLEANNAGLAFELGLLYYRDSQKDKALAEMARAVGLFKDFSNARWYLALMLEEKGNLEAAIEQLNEILKLEVNKGNQTVKDKLAALEKGKREFPPGKITSRKPLEENASQ